MTDANNGGKKPSPMVECEEVGSVTILRVKLPMLQGDSSTDEVFDQLYDAIATPNRSKFILDVATIEYFASAALGKLMTLNRKVREKGARLVLCNLTPTVERILQVSRLSDLLLSYENERQARQALA